MYHRISNLHNATVFLVAVHVYMRAWRASKNSPKPGAEKAQQMEGNGKNPHTRNRTNSWKKAEPGQNVKAKVGAVSR